ncbi:MAG: UvrD-helicase domain-containing protein [Clostridia bacterium]
MNSYNQSLEQEKEYLDMTINILQSLIKVETDKLTGQKKELISSRKEMWENSVHFSDDFDKLTEMNQHLQQVQSRTCDYESTRKSIDKYSNMLGSSYFGRFDFKEEGYEETEKIYIGKGNVTDPNSRAIVVYDWRAPISSMFYRFEPGRTFFKAPMGEINGEITLKRQYKIAESQLKYFFDCSIQISDEILQEVLGQNASPQMRSIIETIQKEQDIIIRDTDSDLLIVQGVAGSGKTSIALHRIAFLLYEGISSNLSSSNILILSPNDAFIDYIAHVLPDLGEENVEQTTMEAIIRNCFNDEAQNRSLPEFHGRNKQIEACITGCGDVQGDIMSSWVQFKGSDVFRIIIDRYLKLYERQIHTFEDVYYSGKLIASRNELKAEFLNNKTRMPMAKRLKRIENRIFDAIVNLRKDRLKKLEGIVQSTNEHEFEVKSFSRLLLMKESQIFTNRIRGFTEIDVFEIYRDLFGDKELFYKLSRDLTLPQDIEGMIQNTYQIMKKGLLYYEDWTAIAYMKLKTFGTDENREIRQVIIDEVQDYYSIQLAIMKALYGGARFTVVGDIAQSIERSGELSIYDKIPKILNKSRTVRLSLNRSYRSSYEINEFAKGIIGGDDDCISFPRYEEKPEMISSITEDTLLGMMMERVQRYLYEGFKTVTILCKTMKQAENLYSCLRYKTDIMLFNGEEREIDNILCVMPVYMAKGREFDAVLVYGVDNSNYCTPLDKRLLYIACTRALHRLSLYYVGNRSPFLIHS